MNLRSWQSYQRRPVKYTWAFNYVSGVDKLVPRVSGLFVCFFVYIILLIIIYYQIFYRLKGGTGDKFFRIYLAEITFTVFSIMYLFSLILLVLIVIACFCGIKINSVYLVLHGLGQWDIH